MTSRRAAVETHRADITDAVRRHGGRSIAIFGSVARGDDSDTSDIDFLVQFEPGSSLFDVLHLHDELESMLGFPVDVISAGALKSRDEHIRAEAVSL